MRSNEELANLYSFLEEQKIDLPYSHNIISELFKFKNELQKSRKQDEIKYCQWEIDFFQLVISENIRLHDISNLTDEQLNYLRERSKQVKSLHLKARYFHLLWFSPLKHKEYAVVATEAYLKLITHYFNECKNQSDSQFGQQMIPLVKNAHCLSNNMQDEKMLLKIKEKILFLVHNFSFEHCSAYYIRWELIDLMLKNNKLFDKNSFEGIDNICDQLAKQAIESSNFLPATRLYKSIIKIYRRFNIPKEEWYNKIAETHEKEYISKQNENVASSICNQAIKYYRKAGNEKKVQELQPVLIEGKKRLKFVSVETQIDLSKIHTENTKRAEKITEQDVSAILAFLTGSPDVIPTYEMMEKQDEGSEEKILDMLSESLVDENKNTTQYFEMEEEKRQYRISQNYSFWFKASSSHLIYQIFTLAIKKKKLSIYTITSFFQSNSWFGKNLHKSIASSDKYDYNWLNLIFPALHEYFLLMEQRHMQSHSINNINLVLCIDSLTLKFEGLLRDFCNFNNIPTTFGTQDKKGRDIEQNKDINALLYESQLEEIIGKDDISFLRFLLTENSGFNLRNKIAHCNLRIEEYSFDIMHFLIIGLLKLGKYDFSQ